MSGARGSVIKRGKTYTVVLEQGRDPSGKRIRKWHSGFATKREAEEARSDLLGKMDRGEYTPPNRITVKEFAESSWLPFLEAQVTGGALKPSTTAQYKNHINAHVVPRLGQVLLRDLTAPMLNKFYADLLDSGRRRVGKGQAQGLSRTTVHSVHVAIHKMLKDAVRWNLVPRNVADHADAPRPKATGEETTSIWSPAELKSFVDAVSEERLSAIWVLFIMTGMRRGEVAGLRWSDIDLEAGVLRVRQTRVVVGHLVVEGTPKSLKSRRDVGLDEATVAVLKSFRARQATERLAWGPAYKGSDLVAVWEDGRPIHPAVISRIFKRLGKKLGLPSITVHDLRHSYATAALEAGISLKVVSDRLGHSSISITGDIYSHVRREIDQDAANRVAGLIRSAG